MSCLGLHWTNDLPGAMIQVISLTLNNETNILIGL